MILVILLVLAVAGLGVAVYKLREELHKPDPESQNFGIVTRNYSQYEDFCNSRKSKDLIKFFRQPDYSRKAPKVKVFEVKSAKDIKDNWPCVLIYDGNWGQRSDLDELKKMTDDLTERDRAKYNSK